MEAPAAGNPDGVTVVTAGVIDILMGVPAEIVPAVVPAALVPAAVVAIPEVAPTTIPAALAPATVVAVPGVAPTTIPAALVTEGESGVDTGALTRVEVTPEAEEVSIGVAGVKARVVLAVLTVGVVSVTGGDSVSALTTVELPVVTGSSPSLAPLPNSERTCSVVPVAPLTPELESFSNVAILSRLRSFSA